MVSGISGSGVRFWGGLAFNMKNMCQREHPHLDTSPTQACMEGRRTIYCMYVCIYRTGTLR